MAAPPAVRQYIPGETETDGYINAGLATPLAFILQKPLCILQLTTAQTIATATVTPIGWSTELYDNTNMHSLISNTNRLAPTISGWYKGTLLEGWVGNATGYRQGTIVQNATGNPWGENDIPSVGVNGMVVNVTSVPFFCNGTTDYCDIRAWQNSGGNLNVTTNTYFSLEFESR